MLEEIGEADYELVNAGLKNELKLKTDIDKSRLKICYKLDEWMVDVGKSLGENELPPAGNYSYKPFTDNSGGVMHLSSPKYCIYIGK